MDKRESVHHEQSDNKSCPHGSCSATRGSAFMQFIHGPWIAVVAAAAIIIIICFTVWILHICSRTRSKNNKKGMFGRSVLGSMWDREPCQPDFMMVPFHEIEEATNDFHDDNLIGKGAQGAVYQGRINDKVVAIKKLKEKALDEFRREIAIVKDIRHTNVLLMLGCSFDIGTETPYLIYEYLPVGNLYQLLHRDEEDDTSSRDLPVRNNQENIRAWSTRHYIAMKVAEGLAYLHSIEVLHRDIKSHNILLDSALEPKIADFGIAKRSTPEDREQLYMSAMKGTCGYTCPEYCRDAIYEPKSDVYSFGVLLAELLTGLPALIYKNEKVVDLATHFRATSKTNLESVLATEIVDSDEITMSVISRVASLVCECVIPTRDPRPEMELVLKELQQMHQDLMGPNSDSPTYSPTSPMLGDRHV